MSVFYLQDVLEAGDRVVAANGDFTYVSDGVREGCSYERTAKAPLGCFVNAVVVELTGRDVLDFGVKDSGFDAQEVGYAMVDGEGQRLFGDAVIDMLSEAQRLQDDGVSWGEAWGEAKRYVGI